MRIVFPEFDNDKIREAIRLTGVEAVPAADLEDACLKLKSDAADAMIAGLDHSTRDVILAARDYLGATGNTFSACCYFEKPEQEPLIIADTAAYKHPTEAGLYDICLQTYETASHLFDTPKLAILSFSTHGSGGHDDTMTIAQNVVNKIHTTHPHILIDGELQLDAAVSPAVAAKKCPGSKVAGSANVLIAPDLNSGNILYKSLEYFAAYHAAGPILQGFKKPISDLSRGSSIADIVLTIKTIERILASEK